MIMPLSIYNRVDLQMMEAKVTCFSSSSYANRPLALDWEGEQLSIEAVLVEKRTPTGKSFTVLAGGGRLFDLDYNESTDTWRVELR